MIIFCLFWIIGLDVLCRLGRIAILDDQDFASPAIVQRLELATSGKCNQGQLEGCDTREIAQGEKVGFHDRLRRHCFAVQWRIRDGQGLKCGHEGRSCCRYGRRRRHDFNIHHGRGCQIHLHVGRFGRLFGPRSSLGGG